MLAYFVPYIPLTFSLPICLDPDSSQIQLKTGRTTHLVRRLGQWTKQCSSKEHVLRGWYPGGVDPDTGLPSTSLMKGRVDAGNKGPSCHRIGRCSTCSSAFVYHRRQSVLSTSNSRTSLRKASTSSPTGGASRRDSHQLCRSTSTVRHRRRKRGPPPQPWVRAPNALTVSLPRLLIGLS